jgi:hypothetical protein
MEKGCILPDNLVKKLDKESMVVYSLARFCECTTDELLDILKKRNETDEYLSYGYKRVRRKVGNKTRTLREPYDTLKKVQKIIKDRLAYILVSLSST